MVRARTYADGVESQIAPAAAIRYQSVDFRREVTLAFQWEVTRLR